MGSAADEVIAIVRRISGSNKVGLESRILQDLSIAGDDAFELLRELRSRFGASISELDFQRYFPDEGEALGYHWAGKLRLRRREKAPLTVEHLIAVVKRGKWFDPAIKV